MLYISRLKVSTCHADYKDNSIVQGQAVQQCSAGQARKKESRMIISAPTPKENAKCFNTRRIVRTAPLAHDNQASQTNRAAKKKKKKKGKVGASLAWLVDYLVRPEPAFLARPGGRVPVRVLLRGMNNFHRLVGLLATIRISFGLCRFGLHGTV